MVYSHLFTVEVRWPPHSRWTPWIPHSLPYSRNKISHRSSLMDSQPVNTRTQALFPMSAYTAPGMKCQHTSTGIWLLDRRLTSSSPRSWQTNRYHLPTPQAVLVLNHLLDRRYFPSMYGADARYVWFCTSALVFSFVYCSIIAFIITGLMELFVCVVWLVTSLCTP